MKTTNPLAVALLLWGTAGAATVLSQEPPWLNAKIQTRPVTTGLELEFRALVNQQSGLTWIGYAIPAVKGGPRICYDSDGGMNTRNDDDRVEGNRAHRIVVLFRVADPQVSRIRVFSEVRDAVDTIIEAARHDRSRKVREQALFWLSQKAGQKAADAIADVLQNDPETEIKKRAVFALSQLPKDESIPRLIQVARTLRNKVVLQDAIFWLGQSRDPRALAFFEEVLTK